jgi:hypothetical protein
VANAAGDFGSASGLYGRCELSVGKRQAVEDAGQLEDALHRCWTAQQHEAVAVRA